MLGLAVMFVSVVMVSSSPLASPLVVEDTAALEKQLKDLAVVLEGKEDALEYASYQLSGGGWNNVKVSSDEDLAERKQITGEDLRKRLAAIIAATKKEETQKNAEIQAADGSGITTKDATEASADYFYSYDTDAQTTNKPPAFGFLGVTIGDTPPPSEEQSTNGVVFKLINIRTGDETTTVQDTTTEQETTTTEVATTTEPITTTEIPAEDKAKEGSVELLVTSITAGGSSIQWSDV